jgi:hypothetical protein
MSQPLEWAVGSGLLPLALSHRPEKLQGKDFKPVQFPSRATNPG